MFWRLILLWLIGRVRSKIFNRKFGGQRVVTFDGKFLFWRFAPFANDEWVSAKDGVLKHWNRPPWWRPFNALLHQWLPEPGTREGWHDHPRWSITICLAGEMIEHTPWGDNHLRPGSIIFRSRKYIHAFSVPKGSKPWTLFIVGRRNHAQNSYAVFPRGRKTETSQEAKARDLLKRLRQWDHLDGAGDGAFWKAEIDRVLAE